MPIGRLTCADHVHLARKAGKEPLPHDEWKKRCEEGERVATIFGWTILGAVIIPIGVGLADYKLNPRKYLELDVGKTIQVVERGWFGNKIKRGDNYSHNQWKRVYAYLGIKDSGKEGEDLSDEQLELYLKKTDIVSKLEEEEIKLSELEKKIKEENEN